MPYSFDIDQLNRKAALNIQDSFIVEAPAGSGKTALLTQRYLALLSEACAAPEEIIAITFTRKAAAEMRARILAALPTTDAILQSPERLRILTIDALAAQISSRMPLSSGYCGQEQITEDPIPYYQQTAYFLLTHLTVDYPWTNAILTLLAHLDNRVDKLAELFIDMLSRREQWLPHIIASSGMTQDIRKMMEQGLVQIVFETLTAAQKHLPIALTTELIPLLRSAAQNLLEKHPAHPLTACLTLREWPTSDPQQLSVWLSIINLLTTQEGKWRKSLDTRQGFPPKTEIKFKVEKILASLADNSILLHHFNQIKACPPLQYTDAQWQIIAAVVELLPLLAAQLQVTFQQHEVIDFIELNLAALRALGETDQPTDLALSLDHRIRHLLVDEFQDTSETQCRLLEKLLAGWEAGDGRTLFLVGDPMQSIYRFRNAEVSLFLRTKQQGLGPILPQSVMLACNFRSQEKLVAWCNAVFPALFPIEPDHILGGIPYSPAQATQAATNDPAVCCYPLFTDTQAEAEQVVKTIQQLRQQHATQTIAILVRSRQQLSAIISALQATKISFQATDIEPLSERSEIEDLTALTRALHHRADRIAWLAVLRAPYCGLSLADLHILANAGGDRMITETLSNHAVIDQLSADGQQRLQRIIPVLSQALLCQGQESFVEWIEKTWLALGGPAGLNNETQLLNVQTYFALLASLEQETPVFNLSSLTRKLQNLYAAPDVHGDSKLQIMTIHKAKGLEFDHVILPSLGQKVRPNPQRLLLWLERPRARGGSDLLLAPIKTAKSTHDSMYDYLLQVEKKKLDYETQRLFYVAVTRAKHSLHLLAVAPKSHAEGFLAMLPVHFQVLNNSEIPQSPPTHHTSLKAFSRILTRVSAGWHPPSTGICSQSPQPLEMHTPIPLTLPARQAQLTGTIIHEMLAQLAKQAPDFHNPKDLQQHLIWEQRLTQLGLSKPSLTESLTLIQRAMTQTLQDPRGQWILSAAHSAQANEMPLSAVLNNTIIHVIIDRTFIDEQGVRWIIDYKTNIDENIQESHYQQLMLYAQIMALQEQRPIKLGLYFPLSGEWYEWDYKYEVSVHEVK